MASNPLYYQIPKGIVSWKPDGGSYGDLGNCSTLDFTPNLTFLEHKSSRLGVGAVDRKVVTQKSATLKFILDEITTTNLALSLLGTATGSTIDIFVLNEAKGSLKFEGANDIGGTLVVEFPLVTLTPANSIAFIGDTWATLELQGDVLADPDTGSFGSCVVTDPDGV